MLVALDPIKKKAYAAQYYLAHKDEAGRYMRKYCRVHREEKREYDAQYYASHTKQKSINGKVYYAHNKEKINCRKNEYRRNHPEKWREYKSMRYKTDIQYRLSECLRTRIRDALRRHRVVPKRVSAVRDLGCSMSFFVKYLEGKFLPGMSWNNYGIGPNRWSIDHIKPLASFDLTNSKQVQQAVNFVNLQPLWHIDNIKKGAKIV